MTKKILIAVLILPVIILVGVFFWIGSVNKPEYQPTPEQKEAKPPKSSRGMFSGTNVDLEDFSFTEYIRTDSGVKKGFELSGKRFQTKNPRIGFFRIGIGRIVELEKPKITFYKNNLPVSTAEADTGAINSLKGITFYGSVTLMTEEKKILTCDKLKWNNEEKYLLAEGDTVINNKGELIKAEVIKTDVELKECSINSRDRKWSSSINRLFLGGRRR
jgi:hypothetical protein